MVATFNGVLSADLPVGGGFVRAAQCLPVFYIPLRYGESSRTSWRRLQLTTYATRGDVIKRRLTGFAFADDLVLMADNVADMRVLMIACEAE